MLPAPGRRMRRSRRSRNWTSFSSPWARAWDGHEVIDLAVGRLALHYAQENPNEVVAALDDKTEAVTNAESNQLEVCLLWSLYV
jgi:predicted RNA methylase